MTGKYIIKYYLVLLILFTVVESSFATQQLINDQIERSELSLYKDLDSDGVSDYNDDDIDGDGVHNLIDSKPLDPQIFGADMNNNGLLDHVEHSYFRATQLQLMNEDLSLIVDKKISKLDILDYFKEQSLLKLLRGLSVLKLEVCDLEKLDGVRGSYDPDWRVIRVCVNTHRFHNFNRLSFFAILIHESFHHYAHMHPLVRGSVLDAIGAAHNIDPFFGESCFLDDVKFLPSQYAYENCDEAFAEVMTYHYSIFFGLSFKRFASLSLNNSTQLINDNILKLISELE